MKLSSVAIILATIVNLINAAPEIKSAAPSQYLQTPAFLIEQQRRYTEAVKDRHQYLPLPAQVIPQKTDRHENRGSLPYGREYRPALSPTIRYVSRQNGRQYQPRTSSVISQKTHRDESYTHGNQFPGPVIPQKTDRHESYARGNQLPGPVIPQKTDRHESYARGNQLPGPVIPQKTDRHENQGIRRNEKFYRIDSSRSRPAPNGADSDVEELWSTRGGSVKSEITDTRLKLAPRYTEGVKS